MLKDKYQNRTKPRHIIHVIGAAGSGKTTLGNRLAKLTNVMVVDTDDIDDKNSILILENKQYDNLFNGNNLDKYFKLLKDMNAADVKKIITDNPTKTIVFVGLSVDLARFATVGYCIETDPRTNFFNVNKRTLTDIIEHKDALTSLLNTNMPTEKIFEIILKKYKIRVPFLAAPSMIADNIHEQYNIANRNRYKIMSPDDIYQSIASNIT